MSLSSNFLIQKLESILKSYEQIHDRDSEFVPNVWEYSRDIVS